LLLPDVLEPVIAHGALALASIAASVTPVSVLPIARRGTYV
jgi:hypothetical protein